MPTDTPELLDVQSMKKKTPDPGVPGLKKRKLDLEEQSTPSKHAKDPWAELMNTLQARVEDINYAVHQVAGVHTAIECVEELVDSAFSNFDAPKKPAEPTKNDKTPFNLSPMSDAGSPDSLLDTLDFADASKFSKEKESEFLELESEAHLTCSW